MNTTANSEVIAALAQSNIPIDWVSLKQFAAVIGEKSDRLYRQKDNMPEGFVWQKLEGKIYFSLKGWNEWMNAKRCREVLGSEAIASTSLSQLMASENTLHSPIRPQRKVFKRQVKSALT